MEKLGFPDKSLGNLIFGSERFEIYIQNINLSTKFFNSATDEQLDSIVTMNFHSDISKTFHDLLFMKGHYLDALRGFAISFSSIQF